MQAKTFGLMLLCGSLPTGFAVSREYAAPPAMPPVEAVAGAFEPGDGPFVFEAGVKTATPPTTVSVRLDPAPAPWSGLTYWKESADSLANVTTNVTAGYNVLVSGVQVEGTGMFRLAHPVAKISNETILLNPSFAVGPTTKLFFESRLGVATPDQVARAEISTNDGASWSILWSRQGTGNPGQTAFERVTVPLAAYVGQTVRLRFAFVLPGGSLYLGTPTNWWVGWLLDDIQVGTAYQIDADPYDIGDPTGMEQQSLEFINRARASAAAEALRLRDTDDPDVVAAMAYFNVDKVMLTNQFATLTETVPPLAFNAKLIAAARLHSQDMLLNAFQGHTSSTNPIPPNLEGDGLAQRLAHQDYDYARAAENVFAYGNGVWHAHAGFNIDWGSGPGGMQSPPGHRNNIHNANYREVGIGIVEGSNEGVGPLEITQDFGTELGADQPFITGVAWDDLNQNGFYDPGEGLAGIEVIVVGERRKAYTSTSGGYAVPVVADGTYRVRFLDATGPNWSSSVTVSDQENVKLDYRRDQITDPTVAVAGWADHPVTPGMRRLAIQTDGSILELESSTDLVAWEDRPEIEPQGQGDGVFWFDILRSHDTEFFRAKAAY